MTQTFHEYRAAIDAQLDSPLLDYEAVLLWGEPVRRGEPVKIKTAVQLVQIARRDRVIKPDRRELEARLAELKDKAWAADARKNEAEAALTKARQIAERAHAEVYYLERRLEAHKD